MVVSQGGEQQDERSGRRLAPVYESLNSQERHSLAHSKRFLERISGDETFRDAVLAGVYSLADAARDCGCDIDVTTLRPVFDPALVSERKDLDEELWPLAAQWRRYIGSILNGRPNLLVEGGTSGHNPAFDGWRERQISRTCFDLGYMATGLTHPPIAFELSSGCSVGCWFCGISAERFRGHHEFDEDGRRDWREILIAARSILGPALGAGFLYWATEPLDNPQYLGFLDEFRDVAGVYPQTTTAIPLRNVELTRGVLDRWEKEKSYPNRFSILNTSVLKKVHAEFTPEELLGVELVLQNRGNVTNSKTGAGRAFSKAEEKSSDGLKKGFRVQTGTIACVSGFLVNIVERTVRLVSPCMATERLPNGYIVIAEERFTDGENLASVMRSIVDLHMATTVRTDVPLQLAENIHLGMADGRHFLESGTSRMRSETIDLCAPYLAGGARTPRALVKRAVENGANPFKMVSATSTLWEAGLLSEVHPEASATMAA